MALDHSRLRQRSRTPQGAPVSESARNGRDPEVSVVLPAYNEADTLETTVETTLDRLEAFLPDESFEVLVAEDGCSDRTPAIAGRLANEDERVHHVHSDDRLGRGGALERAFRAAGGGVLVYFDTDMATDMRHLEELVESVRSGDYDIATGSRSMPGEEIARPTKRDVASRGFNWLVHLFLRSDVRDHQCGFKAFDRAALFSLLDDVEDDHWFWDTEVLVRAQREGYRVKEFPVDWTPMGDTKVDLVRDVMGMGWGVLRTWWDVSVDPRLTPRRTAAAGMAIVGLAGVLLLRYFDPATLLAEIRGADLSLIAAAAGVYLVSWPLRGQRYRRILGQLGFAEDVGFLTGTIFLSQTGNLVFPARAGDAIRAYLIKARRGIPYATGGASIAIERFYDLLTITVLAGTVLAGLAATSAALASLETALVAGDANGRTGILAAGVVGSAAILVGGTIAVSARSGRNYIRSGIRRLSSDLYADAIAGIVERFASDVQQTVADRETFAKVGAISLLIWTLDVLTAVIVVAAIGIEVPVLSVVTALFFAVTVGNLAKVLPLSPGGIGLYEGAFSLIVVALTPIPWAVALGAAIVDHAIKNLVTTAGGLGAMALMNVSLTTAVEEGRDVEPLAGD